jgi:single-strand DNA-binding protein
MADINHVVLVGRLTRDAELRYTNSGLQIGKFSVAINRRRKQGDQWIDEANFFDVVLMGRQAEAIHQYLKKGKQVGIEGELRQDRWEQDGQRRSKVEVYARNVQLLGGSGGGRSGDFGGGDYGSAGGSSGSSASGGSNESFEDDVPF